MTARTLVLLLLAITAVTRANYDEKPENEQTTGVFYDWGAFEGVNFFSVHTGRDSYLINNYGTVLQQWVEPDGLPYAAHSDFTPEGTLIRGGRMESEYFNDFVDSGGDVIREYDRKGECIWEFRYSPTSIGLPKLQR